MSIVYDFKENIKKDELDKIADKINEGGIVVFPTETVYGIGADATNANAVEKIFIAKGRPQDNPLIVHISNLEMLKDIVYEVTETEKLLMDTFWPGPLTIILKSKKTIPDAVTAKLDTVGIRMPDNDIALNIIEASKKPIAAPSANVSGKPSGTELNDIYNELKERVDIFVDGGKTNIGIESTVLKVDENNVVNILRPGMISKEDIEKLGLEVRLDKHIFEDVKDNEKVESPGMKHRHYAPNTQTVLLEYNDEANIMINKVEEFKRNNENKKIGVICFNEHEKLYKDMGIMCINIGSKSNLMEISRNIFSYLRKVDDMGLDVCIIEGVKKEYIGTAIMNRLIRACQYNIL